MITKGTMNEVAQTVQCVKENQGVARQSKQRLIRAKTP